MDSKDLYPNVSQVHHYHGSMCTNVFHGVAPHTLTLAGNQLPPKNSTSERSILEHVPPKSDQIPLSSLCDTITRLHLDGERSRKFFIHHPEIDRRVCELLQNKDKTELWDAAHALRDLRRECLASSTPLLQFVDLVLNEVDDAIRSETKDFAQCRLMDKDGQNAITAQGRNSRIFYSIIMLSYGAEATLIQDGISHRARLEDVLLPTRGEVILVFKYFGKAHPYHQITVSDLSKFYEYGIELDLGAFSNLISGFGAQPRSYFHKEMALPLRGHNLEIKPYEKGSSHVHDQRQESSTNTWYACIFTKCFEKFGNKSAWSRHENWQHFQQECWLCPFCPRNYSNQVSMHENEDGNGKGQTRLFYNRCVYVKHLRSVHSADDDTTDQQIREQRIGRGCRSRFWCGFCEEIVPLQKKGLEGVNERFDHIEGHFRGGEQIANYIEMDGCGVKGKDPKDGESDGCHTSIASSECDTNVSTFQDGGARRNDGIDKIGMTREESVADADDWDGDFNPTPLLERPSSLPRSGTPTL